MHAGDEMGLGSSLSPGRWPRAGRPAEAKEMRAGVVICAVPGGSPLR